MDEIREEEVYMEWTFLKETEPSEEIIRIMLADEVVECAYKTDCDIAAVTNKRIIITDKQGLTGKKIEILSLPYSSIYMYSLESSGRLFESAAVLELWTKAGAILLYLKKKINIRKLDKLIAAKIV